MNRTSKSHDIKAVVPDVDGTIAHREQPLPTPIRTFLTRTPRAPRFITLATGNAFGRLEVLDLTKPCSAPIITEGGGRIVHPETGDTVISHPVEQAALERFAQRVVNGDINLQYACYAKDGAFPYTFLVAPDEPVPKRYANGNPQVFRNVNEFVESAWHSKACKINFRIQRDSVCPGDHSITWNEGSADLLARGVNKATGLIELTHLIGLSLSEVLFAGNDENDLEPLALQGPLKFVVGNHFPDEPLRTLGVHARVESPEAFGHALLDLFP